MVPVVRDRLAAAPCGAMCSILECLRFTGSAESLDQHSTGRGTRRSSSGAPTGVLGRASADRLASEREARANQPRFPLPGLACAARRSAAAARSSSCRRVSASTSIVKKLCITAPVLLHHDSVNRTWQWIICETRCRSGCSLRACGRKRWQSCRNPLPATPRPCHPATAARHGRPGTSPPNPRTVPNRR
jgi:hypothetical protein